MKTPIEISRSAAGQNHSAVIIVTHLLAHTSGLPDYFSDSVPGGHTIRTPTT